MTVKRKIKQVKWFQVTVVFPVGKFLEFPAMTTASAKRLAAELIKTETTLSEGTMKAVDVIITPMESFPAPGFWPFKTGVLPQAASTTDARAQLDDTEKLESKFMYSLMWATKMEHRFLTDPSAEDDLVEARRVVTYLLSELHKAGRATIEAEAPYQKYQDVTARALAARRVSPDNWSNDAANNAEAQDRAAARARADLKRAHRLETDGRPMTREREDRDTRAGIDHFATSRASQEDLDRQQRREDAFWTPAQKAARRTAERMNPEITREFVPARRVEDDWPWRIVKPANGNEKDLVQIIQGLPGRVDNDVVEVAIFRTLEKAEVALAQFGSMNATRTAAKSYFIQHWNTQFSKWVRHLDEATHAPALRSPIDLESADNAARKRIKNLNKENVADAKRHLSQPVKGVGVRFRSHEHWIAEHYASPLINGDYSGLDFYDDEAGTDRARFDAWVTRNSVPTGGHWDVTEEVEEFYTDEVSGLKAKCVKAIYHYEVK